MKSLEIGLTPEQPKKQWKVVVEMEGWGKDGTEYTGSELWEEVTIEALDEDEASDTAIDMDLENISLAKSRYGNTAIKFLHGDATRDLPQEQFDVVVLSNVLEHIQNRIDFIRKIIASVQPNRFLIRIPLINRDWSVALRKELGLPYYSDPGHYVEYTPESFKEEMNDAGMEVRFMIINWGEIWAEVNPQFETGYISILKEKFHA